MDSRRENEEARDFDLEVNKVEQLNSWKFESFVIYFFKDKLSRGDLYIFSKAKGYWKVVEGERNIKESRDSLFCEERKGK